MISFVRHAVHLLKRLLLMRSRSGLQAEILEILRDVINDLEAVYLFGTWGTGDERPDSDMDLAVLSPRRLENLPRWDLSQRLSRAAGRDVDLIDLGSASTVLRMQVVSTGERIFCSDIVSAERFEDYVFSAYARLNFERREILKDVRERGSVYGK